eukprot:2524867-Rhodomonas_salina.2
MVAMWFAATSQRCRWQGETSEPPRVTAYGRCLSDPMTFAFSCESFSALCVFVRAGGVGLGHAADGEKEW